MKSLKKMMVCGVQSNMEPYFVFQETIYTYDELLDEFVDKGYDKTPLRPEEVMDQCGVRTFNTYEDAMNYLDEMVLDNSFHEEGIN